MESRTLEVANIGLMGEEEAAATDVAASSTPAAAAAAAAATAVPLVGSTAAGSSAAGAEPSQGTFHVSPNDIFMSNLSYLVDQTSTTSSIGATVTVDVQDAVGLIDDIKRFQQQQPHHPKTLYPCAALSSTNEHVATCKGGVEGALRQQALTPVNQVLTISLPFLVKWTTDKTQIWLKTSKSASATSNPSTASSSQCAPLSASHLASIIDRLTLEEHLPHTIARQVRELIAVIGYPSSGLLPDLRLVADSYGWQQHQNALDGSSSSTSSSSTGGGTGMSTLPAAAAARRAQSARNLSARKAVATTTATRPQSVGSSSSANAAAGRLDSAARALSGGTASPAAGPKSAGDSKSGAYAKVKWLTLATGVVKPACDMCQAFDMSNGDFLDAVVACEDGPEQRKSLDLAAMCRAGNDMAHKIVRQAAANAFFTGTTWFIITCYSIAFPGRVLSVAKKWQEGEKGQAGRCVLHITVELSGPIFASDCSRKMATVRGALGFLAHKTLGEQHRIRTITVPDDLHVEEHAGMAETQIAGSSATGGDAGSSRDEHANQRNQQKDQQQQQQQQEQQHEKKQQWQQQQRLQPQQLHSDQRWAVLCQPLEQFAIGELQLDVIIAEASDAIVYRGIFRGQQAIIKMLSMDWEPAGSHLHEAAMYALLYEMQLIGVLPEFLGHGEFFGRYVMGLSEAPGQPLSELAYPYSSSVQQAVQAAVLSLHKQNVVHGDLHAENIFVLQQPAMSPKVTLIDLGRAQLVKDHQVKDDELGQLQRLLGVTTEA